MEYPKESIFKGSIRAFMKAFFVIIGVFLSLILVFIGISFLGDASSEMDKYTVDILPDLNGQQAYLPIDTPAVLRIDIKGVIGAGENTTENIYRLLIESRRGLLKDNRVKAILLYIASPGGSVNDIAGIYKLIMEYKQKYNIPVYAYADGICASGGMYIACSADKILANPSSVIGSVGVLSGPFFNAYETMNKLGLTSLTLTQGKNKDTLSMFRPWKKGEEDTLNDIIKVLYEDFVNVVSSRRPNLTKQKLMQEYGANVYVAKTAKRYGYIDDANSNYPSVLKELLQAANIPLDGKYQVVTLNQKRDWFNYISDAKGPLFSSTIKHTFQLGPYDLSVLKDPFAYLYMAGIKD